MALRKDRQGMAVLVDALVFLVVLTILVGAIYSTSDDGPKDDRAELLRSYHSVMLSGELPGEGGSSMSTATLADYLIALSLVGTPDEEQADVVEDMVNGTIAEMEGTEGRTWLIIELGSATFQFGSMPPEEGGNVYADRRELGDGSVVSTLFLSV
ncbi:MAG TPA: hypothetical protein HA343_02815 [Methanomassiliicoccales archaeon]|nr:hypothetical protein [Methanomassiliicoccales archaeon]